MPQEEVERIVSSLTNSECKIWLDGGWGVDALLGVQTRSHKDLDICVNITDSARVNKLLEKLGYSVTKDEASTRLIMQDNSGHRIDLHLLSFDPNGDGKQTYKGGFHLYPAKDLRSKGRVGRLKVNCLSPELQIRFRQNYTPDNKSKHDTQKLTDKFKLPLQRGVFGNKT